jgi:ribose 5-phosphate isomerase B
VARTPVLLLEKSEVPPQSVKTVLISSDHAGFALKEALKKALPDWNWVDLGPKDAARVDYPDFAVKLAGKLVSGEATQGVLICGSGIGMSIAANKVAGVRAAVVENPIAAQLSKQHNDANVLCLGARFLACEYASEITQAFLSTPFSGEERHAKRVEKINALDSK